jgi:hypothetical protein
VRISAKHTLFYRERSSSNQNARVFRRASVPFGTVSLTTYFHTNAEELTREDINRVLAVADASIFHKGYGDQTGELW